MIKYLTILLTVFIPCASLAQDAVSTPKIRKSNIRFDLGLSHVRMIDEGYTDSRLLFTGTVSKIGLGYGRETDNYIFNFNVEGSIGNLMSQSGRLPSNYYLVHPSVEYLKALRIDKLFGRENKLFLGARLSSFNQGMEDEKVVDNISIFSLHGIYISFHDRMKLTERQYVQLTWQIPAFVFENRLLWNGGASTITRRDTQNIPRMLTSNGNWTYFNMARNIQLGVSYVVETGKATNIRIGYNFCRASSRIEAPLHFYSNELFAELKIKL